MLNCGKHHNEHLQNAWNRYGEENFTFSVLQECQEDQRYKVEADYIKALNACDGDHGYNIRSDTLWMVDTSELERKLKNTHKYLSMESRIAKSKYTIDQILKTIELMQDENMMYDEITKITGVTYSSMKNIRDGVAWKDLTAGIVFPNRKNYVRKGKSARLSESDVKDIIQRLLNAEHFNHIANDYGVYTSTIVRIYKH